MAYSIAKAADMFGLSAHTLRYYDKEGLLPFVERTSSGIRSFSDDDIEWLRLIMCLKDTGMQIKDIKNFIALYVDGDPGYEKRLEIIRRQKSSIEKQMTQLQSSYDMIIHKEQFYLNAIKEQTPILSEF